jgi:hypothetical protein
MELSNKATFIGVVLFWVGVIIFGHMHPLTTAPEVEAATAPATPHVNRYEVPGAVHARFESVACSSPLAVDQAVTLGQKNGSYPTEAMKALDCIVLPAGTPGIRLYGTTHSPVDQYKIDLNGTDAIVWSFKTWE